MLVPMRVSVSHNKSQQEAMKTVDDVVDKMFQPNGAGPLRMTDVRKNWNGSTLNFSMNAALMMMAAPISGTIQVTERDIIIDCDLPPFLTGLLPENKIRAGIESRVRGLLT